jgi:hypothetical protein
VSEETRWSGGDRARLGAGLAAPTSPHATPPDPSRPRTSSGPERFWSRRRVRIALAAAFFVSFLAHYAFSPWTLLPKRTLELRDTEGEITIPIDMIEGPAEPAPPPAPPPPPPPAAAPRPVEGGDRSAVDAGAARDAGPPRPHDAGPPRDAEADGAGRERRPEALARPSLPDAGDAGGTSMDALATGAGDAGVGDGVVAGPTLVEIRVNIATVRHNPVGARLGPILMGIPQWADFLGGTDVDPVKDLDWIWIFGPSLIHTEKDAAVLRYNMTDDRAAKNIATLSKRDVGGGKFDTGVPGVRAWRGRADKAWRVFMLPRAHVAAMVPPDFAKSAAKAFSHVELHTPTGPNEAVRVKVKNPSHPMPFLPTSLTELRFWVVPREAGGADAYVEADAPDARAASLAAKQIRSFVQDENSIGVRLVTRGLLNGLQVTSDDAMVKAHAPVSQEQIEAVYDLVAAFLGVDVSPPVPSTVPSSRGSASPAPRHAP